MSEKENRIMTHLVAGYPDIRTSAEIALLLAESGAAALEIQFPFSDPTADGPAIEKACSASLERGFRVDDGFSLVKEISFRTAVPVFIMTYASIVYASGVKEFAQKASSAGAAGLIIPDLPFDYDEGLYRYCGESGIESVPVVVPSMDMERIKKVLELETGYIYAALRSGTTGTRTEINEESRAFLSGLRKKGTMIMAGFGIRDRDQIEVLKGLADFFIVGSALVEKISEEFCEPGGKKNHEVFFQKTGEYINSLL